MALLSRVGVGIGMSTWHPLTAVPRQLPNKCLAARTGDVDACTVGEDANDDKAKLLATGAVEARVRALTAEGAMISLLSDGGAVGQSFSLCLQCFMQPLAL